MTDAQSNSLDMFLAVNKFYLQNKALIDGVPARALGFGQLGTNIIAINVNLGFQTGTTKGITQDKKVLRITLNTIALTILAPSMAWALSIGNNTMAEMFHVTKSQLEMLKDDTVGAFCQMRLGLVSDNLASMADYGITQPLLDTWAAAITDYDAVLADPRSAIVTRKQKTANLKQLFKQTSTLFTQTLDPLMLPLSLSDPEIYGQYQSARIIIDRGKKSSGSTPKPPTLGAVIYGLVFSSENDLPLFNVSITATYSDNSVAGTATTDAKGAFSIVIEQLPQTGPNTINLLAALDPFQDAIASITAEAGKAYLHSIPMTPLEPTA